MKLGIERKHRLYTHWAVYVPKYERTWSKFGEILVVTIYRLGSFLQYVRAGMGHGRRRRSRSRRGRKIEKTTGWE